MCIAVLLCLSLWNLLVRMGFDLHLRWLKTKKVHCCLFFFNYMNTDIPVVTFLTSNAKIHIATHWMQCFLATEILINIAVEFPIQRMDMREHTHEITKKKNPKQNKTKQKNKNKKHTHNGTQHGKHTAQYLLCCSSLRQLQWCCCCANAVCMCDLQFNCSENETMLYFFWMYSC